MLRPCLVTHQGTVCQSLDFVMIFHIHYQKVIEIMPKRCLVTHRGTVYQSLDFVMIFHIHCQKVIEIMLKHCLENRNTLRQLKQNYFMIRYYWKQQNSYNTTDIMLITILLLDILLGQWNMFNLMVLPWLNLSLILLDSFISTSTLVLVHTEQGINPTVT